MKLRPALVLSLASWAFACSPDAATDAGGWPSVQSPVEVDPALEARVDSILARMTLEEKVGQIIQADVRRVTAEDVARYNLGSVLNGGGGFPNEEKYSSVQDWLDLADMVYDASVDTSDGGVGIPIIWGVDAVHGHNNVIGATLFPHNVGLGAANDPDLLHRIGEVTAREVRVTGHDWNFGPTVAVPRDDRWGRAYEGYSEDPEIVRHYADAMVRGLQGEPGAEDFLDEDHVISTAKHFLADGATDGGVDQGDATAPLTELQQIHTPGYEAALAAGVQSVMVSFSSWNGVKMHANRELLTDVLKGTMGFDGLLVGDWNAHGQIPGCTNASCAETIVAGLDMFMVPDDWRALYDSTLEQARSGEIAADRLDDAVRRILRVKARAGVLDRGRPSSRRYAGDASVLGSPEHRAVAREAVRSSLVLLKNEDGTLPLRPAQTVLVTGDGADDIGKQAGGWTLTWQGTGNTNADFPGASSVWDGIRETAENAGGTAILDSTGTFDASDPPDVAIVVFGEDPYAEFQGDRTDVNYDRDAGELRSMQALREAGVPVVAVFLTGRPLWVNPELNASDAFVVAWLPGSEGAGVADVLFGTPEGAPRTDFRGKLSFSWPKSPDQAVLNRGQEGYDPLFAYGFGLTYDDAVSLPTLPEDVSSTSGAPLARLFDGGPVPPWELFVSAAATAAQAAGTARTETPDGALVVSVMDRRVQEDARTARWNGAATGRVFLAQESSTDLAGQAGEGLALSFDLRREGSAPDRIFLFVEHEADEGRRTTRFDVSAELSSESAGEWRTFRVPLDCIEDAGVNMSQITVPWGLEAAAEGALSFSDVRLVNEGDGPTLCLDPESGS